MKETPQNSKIVAAFQAAHQTKTPFATVYKTWEKKNLLVDTDKPGNPALRWKSATGYQVAVLLIDGEISYVYDAQLKKTIQETEMSLTHKKVIETEREEIKELIALV
jgi:hypothetical protein